MIRSFRVAAALAAISLASCGQPVVDNTPKIQSQSEQAITFKAGADVSVAIFRDSTGCEWLIFRYRGVGISTQPRTEIYNTTDARRQVCDPASRK